MKVVDLDVSLTINLK